MGALGRIVERAYVRELHVSVAVAATELRVSLNLDMEQELTGSGYGGICTSLADL